MNYLADISSLKNNYFIMRHGESDSNIEKVLQSDPVKGKKISGLTKKGKSDVRESALKWAPLLGKGLIIFCSDFRRTRETAEIVKKVLYAKELHTFTLLRERRFRDYDGKLIAESEAAWKKDILDPDQKEGGTESLNEVQERMTKAIMEIEKKYTGKNILIVSHGDPLMVLDMTFKRTALTQIEDVPYIKTSEARQLILG